jgi:hypothetical protein
MHSLEAPSLMQVRARVRAGHALLRAMLDDLELELGQLDLGSVEAPTRNKLADAIWKLFLALDDHLGMEERDLVPHLLEAGGPKAVEHLQKEHYEQRTVLLAMVHECDGTKLTARVVDDARWLIEALRRDMDREDSEFDKVVPGTFLSHDGYVTDQCSG